MMFKNKINKAILKTIKFILFITMIILVFTSKNDYSNFNWFEKIFKAPFYEATFLLNQIMDFRLAYFIVIFVGSLLVFPNFKMYFLKIKNILKTTKEIWKINLRKVNSDEEQIAKVQEMLETYEKSGISMLDTFAFMISCLYSGFLLPFAFNKVFDSEMFINENFNFLWFNLNGKDELMILPFIYIILSAIIPIIIILTKSLKKEATLNKVQVIYRVLMVISITCLMLYPIFNNSAFALILSLIIVFRFAKKTGGNIYAKFFEANKCDNIDSTIQSM